MTTKSTISFRPFLMFFLVMFCFLFALFLIRLFSVKELDDVSPEIPCSIELLRKSDVLWVVPLFTNRSIADDPKWCAKILHLNKTLGLHGVYHTYNEFDTPRDEDYLQEGIDAFRECFGYEPSEFKPPQLAISRSNAQLVRNQDLVLRGKLRQLTHKVYHCSNTGTFSNTFVGLF